jgi:putative membrane-bound dehydrogenase-like protein
VLVGLAAATVWADDEADLFRPRGFERPGEPRTASGADVGTVRIRVTDQATGRPTPCRINVVGSDGNFYQPEPGPLSPFSLTGQWPKTGKGNREGKAPIRYLGRFFYATGEVSVKVPPGRVRVEVGKGLEYRPQQVELVATTGEEKQVAIAIERVVPMAEMGYHSGDPHLHFPRKTEADDRLILDLLEAEDVHYGSILAYNEPAGPYDGRMDTMDTPQFRGLGKASVATRGAYQIASGQEYRSATYGHLNLFWRDRLALEGAQVNADNFPLYGSIARETIEGGGFAFYAHGGYAQAIYADFARKNVNAVELLQFGLYRGIELAGWYDILNAGYRFPCVGASDYPACRYLSDCRTYVQSKEPPDFRSWLQRAAEGRSFVTTGPLLLLDVDGEEPGGVITRTGPGPHQVRVRVRVRSEVAPIAHVQIVVNGKVRAEAETPSAASPGRGIWSEFSTVVKVDRSLWIAARAFSESPSGSPDAEAHTNPVYVDLDGKAPYDQASLDRLIAALDGQMAIHRKRDFPEKARVLGDFQKSRDVLLRIRQEGGLPAGGVPASWLETDGSASFDPTRATHSDAELTAFLRPLPAKTPDEALRTFENVDGMHMELVASEPLVASPVAAAFDADGNLFVAEMRDYPYKPKEGRKPLGRVRLLQDTDGDGRFDRSTIFADGLLWPSGIACWKGGVYVSAAPNIVYLKDTDGDLVADLRETVFTGFGTQNQQAMLNNLTWGLDHKIYGATAGNGGEIRTGNASQSGQTDDTPGPGSAIVVDRRDFRFDPETRRFETITGTVQFGNTFDDWGNRFVCSESQPLLQPVLPLEALARNPFFAATSAIQNIAGGSVPIFRISPIERWREIRSSRRIAMGERSAGSAGASHHVVDAAAGVTIYRGSAYPAEYYGNVFVGDAQNNLVLRQVLIPDGPTFRAERAPREKNTEFVRSSDNWFRPVNFINAPDGTLYVLDMSREILEAIHIPLDVVKHLDLKRGRDQGRIYRIAPAGFRHEPPPRLSQATTAELVSALSSLDAWSRDTAHRLLFERRDLAAVGPLRALLGPNSSSQPPVRVNALWSLEGLGALRVEDLLAGLDDPDPRVRASSLPLAARRLGQSRAILDRVLALSQDDDRRVRFQVALALGETNDPRVVPVLAAIARVDSADRWTRSAVLSSCASTAGSLLAALLAAPSRAEPGEEWLDELARIVGNRNQPHEVQLVLNALAESSPPANQPLPDTTRRLLRSLGQGLSQSGGTLPIPTPAETSPAQPGERLAARLMDEARARAVDPAASESARVDAIASLSLLPLSASRDILVDLLAPQQPQAIQSAAIRALGGSNTKDTDQDKAAIGEILIGRLGQLAPAVQATAIRVLLGRDSWTRRLLAAVSRGDSGLGPASIDPDQRSRLMNHRDPEIASLARSVFGQPSARSRAQIVVEYGASLERPADSSRGAKVFNRECRTCHKIGNEGTAVGPDLSGSPSRDPATLLVHILDPNQYVLPQFHSYVVDDQAGRTYSGIVAAETPTSVTLRRGDGAEDTILRSQIEEMASTGRSLMPEGFEKTIPLQDMADLIAFLRASHRDDDGSELAGASAPAGRQPLDVGTLPGLIEPD